MQFHVLTGCDVTVIMNEPKVGRTIYATGKLREQYRAGTLRSLATDTTKTSESIMADNKITLAPLPNTPPKSFPEGVQVPRNVRSFLFTDAESPTKVAKGNAKADGKGRGRGRAKGNAQGKGRGGGRGRGKGRN
ncbi:uncharacterized protein LOC144880006 [Branchiostoma floridae x Branchiostoma japonicum]